MGEQVQDIITQTVAFWRERMGEKVSQEDAREMVTNVSGFFHVLAEWQRQATEEDGRMREESMRG